MAGRGPRTGGGHRPAEDTRTGRTPDGEATARDAALIRIHDLAGRPRGTGFVAHHPRTVTPSPVAVLGTALQSGHRDVGFAVPLRGRSAGRAAMGRRSSAAPSGPVAPRGGAADVCSPAPLQGAAEPQGTCPDLLADLLARNAATV